MNIILGGTGHVGSAAARRLLELGEPVTVVSHDPAKRDAWERQGARFAVADVRDPEALRSVLRQGKRAFLLNPPADVSKDTDAEERRSVAAILQALEGSGLEHVVAESAMGARAGERVGDLSVLHGLEEGLRRQAIPASVIRAAYYMSNWDANLAAIRTRSRLDTMIPADLSFPMVAPQDLGHAAARLLTGPIPTGGLDIHHVEGPERYSPNDVAAAFGAALGKTVEVAVVPRSEWRAAYRKLGFSEAAADSYARMTEASVDGGFEQPTATEHGEVKLEAYVRELVKRSG